MQPLHALSHQQRGASVEALAAAELLARGHRVAVPFADPSSAVDLVVNYRTTVQCKSSTVRDANNGALRVSLSTRRIGRRGVPDFADVDILLVHACDKGEWWCIPIDRVESVTNLALGKKYAAWREAWRVFE